ncbi:MAG: hypothetical protein ACKOPE_10845 [Novosphingobium sp.]
MMAGRYPAVWGAVFGLGILGIAWLERSGQIGWPWNVVLVGVVSLSLIPLRAAMRNRNAACGTDSPAMRAYVRRSMIWAVSYIVLLGIALTARNTWHPQGPALWLLALLPSLPILFLVWSLGRYLVEEQDEYLRMRQIQAGLFATGLLLAVSTVWGFLETFGIAPHAEGWWAVAVWALGLGLGGMVQNRRERQDGEP